MALIHTTLQKSKKRKPTAKQRELDASWEKLLTKYAPTKAVVSKSTNLSDSGYKLAVPAERSTRQYPSRDTGTGSATKQAPKVYTGTSMLGIATMHKSNSVPVFSSQEATEISSMRR
jgi:hypothetical protein